MKHVPLSYVGFETQIVSHGNSLHLYISNGITNPYILYEVPLQPQIQKSYKKA